MANSNTAYANSGVTQRLRLVYSGEIAYTENPFDMQLDLRNLNGTSDGFMDGVHALRNTYRADFVALLTTGQDYCGIGYLMTTVSTAFASFAFNVSKWGCAMDKHAGPTSSGTTWGCTMIPHGWPGCVYLRLRLSGPGFLW